jgi:hypothetical protein
VNYKFSIPSSAVIFQEMRNLVKENRSNGFHLFNEPKVSLSMSLELRQRVELLGGRGEFSNKSTSKEAAIKLVSILEKNLHGHLCPRITL